jgi:hypothetical protein
VARSSPRPPRGLDHAHRATAEDGTPLNIVHRDISPELMATFDGAVKVIDFGIAKAVGRSVKTQTGTLRGKVPYMSPEQVDGRAIDGRSDVFALGVVLWELLTGRHLFHGGGDAQTMALVARCEVPPPSRLEPAVDAGLDDIALRALAREPGERYQTAGALQRDLEAWIARGRDDASPTQLAAYLRELFAARVATEEAEGPLAASGKAATSVLLERLARTATAHAARRRSSRILFAVAGACAVAATAAVGLFLAPSLSEPAPATAPAAAAPALLGIATTPAGRRCSWTARRWGGPRSRRPAPVRRAAKVSVRLEATSR